jgi:hypothetical protein
MGVWQNGTKLLPGAILSEDLTLLRNADINATAYTQTSGNIWDIEATPGSAGTVVILNVLADGTNWSANSYCMYLKSDNDASVVPLVADVATVSDDAVLIKRGGTDMGALQSHSSGSGMTIVTYGGGDLLLLPDTGGITQVGDVASPTYATTNDDLFVARYLELESVLYINGGTMLWSGDEWESGNVVSLNDDAQTSISVVSLGGFARVMAGDNEESAVVRWTEAAAVTLETATANVRNTDTDGFLCIYGSGNIVYVKNRLGSTKKIMFRSLYGDLA